jgi:hypothetical protein
MRDMTDKVRKSEFDLTGGEFYRFVDALKAIEANHRDDDMGMITITIDAEETGDPGLIVIVREYDGSQMEDNPLARYEIGALLGNEVENPLERTDLRPQCS